MPASKNLAQKVFGRLTAIREVLDTTSSRPRLKWECSCECGNIALVRPDRLLSGKTRSCGCLHLDIARAASTERAELVALSQQVQQDIAASRDDYPVIQRPIKLPPPDSRTPQEQRHGLPRGTYAALLASQGGTCAICGATPLNGANLHVDHDHATRQVRGLLCNACNSGLGLFRDDITLMARAMHYLTVDRPALLSAVRSDKDDRTAEQRKSAYQARVLEWEKARAEKEAAKQQRKVDKAARSAARAATRAKRDTQREERIARQRQELYELKFERERIEAERKAERIARRDARRATKAEAKAQAQADAMRAQWAEATTPAKERAWAAEFAVVAVPGPDYGPASKGLGAVARISGSVH